MRRRKKEIKIARNQATRRSNSKKEANKKTFVSSRESSKMIRVTYQHEKVLDLFLDKIILKYDKNST